MANEKNLKPLNKRTQRERKEIAKKGAEASNKVQRERKAMKEQLDYLMRLEINPKQDKLKKQLIDLGIEPNEINMQMATNVSLVQQAIKGNVKAYEVIRDTLGEKPIEKVEQINPPSIVIERPKKKKNES